MNILKFKGDFEQLKMLKYTLNHMHSEPFAYIKNVDSIADVTIRLISKNVTFSHYDFDETAAIYQYLIEHDFMCEEKCNRIALYKESQTFESFEYSKHDAIGLYGVSVSAADSDVHSSKVKVITIYPSLIPLIKELHEHDLVKIVDEF